MTNFYGAFDSNKLIVYEILGFLLKFRFEVELNVQNRIN
jgi:hypothetical protein